MVYIINENIAFALDYIEIVFLDVVMDYVCVVGVKVLLEKKYSTCKI